MKLHTPGFWLIVATVGLLALLPMRAVAGMTPEEVRAFKQYEAAARKGDLVAQNSLGLCYYFGRGVAKDYVQAVNLWRKGANQGDAYAQHLLAHRYATGEGVAKDSVQAVNLWRKSAAQGNAKAQFELGNCYLTGEGVVKDAVEAAKWYRKSADQGYAAAAKSLDSLNRKTPSKGTPPTETTVTALDGARVVITKKGNVTNVETVAMSPEVKWYRKGADQGDAQAQFNLGVCYSYGLGVAKDHVEAAKWYRKAAEQGKASAQFGFGGCYAEGECVAQDLDEAAKWYRKAAEQGYDGAKYHLNRLNDEVEAVKGYRKGADQGNPKAQFNLGNSYHLGRGVAKDAVEAAKWYRKAAEQGDAEAAKSLASLNRMTPSKGTPATETTVTTLDGVRVVITKKGNVTNVETVGKPPAEVKVIQDLKAKAVKGDRDAQRDLAMAYGEGEGVAQDYTEAAKWFRKAAEQGDTISQYATGSMCEHGDGVAKDLVEALRWYRKAADQGYARAQFNVGNSYYHGSGVTRNYAEAIKWYRKSAEQGDVIVTGLALSCLGYCYANGQGVTKNPIEAYAHYDLAGATVAGARKALMDLAPGLTTGQLVAAKKRSVALEKELDVKSPAKKAGK